MKTKKFFMLLAAVLLSASAMAQSGNNQPLNGDVNGDGTVDVADMVGVIKIMKDGGGAVGEKQAYWYAGTNGGNAVTADNFTDVATKIAESEIPQTGTVTASGQYVYIVLPETRHLESLNDEGGSAVEFTCTDVMGYHIYRTVGAINTKLNYTIEETTYYLYVGHVTNEQFENPDSLASIITTYGTATSDTTGPSTLTIPTTTGDVLVYIYPTIWDTPNIVDHTGYGTGDMSYEEVELTPPSGYNVRFWDGDSSVRGKTLNIKWE